MHTRKCHFRVIYGPPRCLSQLNGYIYIFLFCLASSGAESADLVSFYRATRGLCCSPYSVCLSDCLSAGRLSVTFVHCIQTADDIVKLLFFWPGSSIILVFDL